MSTFRHLAIWLILPLFISTTIGCGVFGSKKAVVCVIDDVTGEKICFETQPQPTPVAVADPTQ